MKKPIRKIAIVLCNLLIFCLLAEAAGLVTFFVQEGALFYIRPAEEDVADTDTPRSGAFSIYRLQPYWGFSARLNMQRPRTHSSTNNYGFVSPVDFPLSRDHQRQAFVGVFGGSVAAQLTLYGGERLREVLAADPRFAGREPVLLNFAAGGYKQPQQLQILSYFLSLGQEFDVVVNIDGFNEVALSPFNRRDGIGLAMPSATHFLPLVDLLDSSTLTVEQIDALYEINGLRQRLDTLDRKLRNTRFAALYLVRDAWRRHLASRYSYETTGFEKLAAAPARTSLVAIAGPERDGGDDEAMFRTVAGRWAEASLLMQQLLAARGIPYIHVLQPNQYFTRRNFSEEEKALAIKEKSPLRPNAARGYPFLLERAPWLLGAGVRFCDATGIFDDVPEIVYTDSCCHYNQLGNELLAKFIADRVLEAWPQ